MKIRVRKGKKTVFRKTVRSSYLFVFPSGAVQVSQSNIRHAIIDRLKDEGTVVGIINTKEGVW